MEIKYLSHPHVSTISADREVHLYKGSATVQQSQSNMVTCLSSATARGEHIYDHKIQSEKNPLLK